MIYELWYIIISHLLSTSLVVTNVIKIIMMVHSIDVTT